MKQAFVFLLMWLALLAPARAQTDTMPVSMGINVDFVDDYATESFFVDAMKQSRHWGSVNTPWDESATVDSLGWPTQDAGVVVLCCVADLAGNSLLPGSYALSFQGQAQVALNVFPGTVTDTAYDAATNTSTATVTLADSGSGTSLYLAFTSTRRTPDAAQGTGVTNVTLQRPQLAPNGHRWWNDPKQIFTTPYLNLVSGFSTLRFMDFESTNGTAVTQWGQRTLPSFATQQTANGAAWEYTISLANTVKRDVWVNIPDQANDAYVQKLASLLYRTLDPSLHIYTEYSNEVWNYSFPQAGRNQAAAEAEVAAHPKSPLAIGCPDYDNCRYEWGERRVGQRAVQIGQIFRGVFGARAPQVRPIYATQLDQTYFVGLVMSMLTQAYGKPADLLYGIAQAPYFTGDNSTDGLTENQLLAGAAANLPSVAQAAHDFAAVAIYYGLHSVTYEGGPGMFGQPSLDNKIAANRSSQIGKLVGQSLRDAFGNGISLYMYFNDAGAYSQYGMWGTTENIFAQDTSKLKAIHAVQADGVEPLITNHTLPASFPGAYPDFNNGIGYIVNDKTYAYLATGGSSSYLINVPATGTYATTLSTANYAGATKGVFRIDQAPAGSFTVPAGTGPGEWTPTPPVGIMLTAGLHVLSITAPHGGFALQTVSLAAP